MVPFAVTITSFLGFGFAVIFSTLGFISLAALKSAWEGDVVSCRNEVRETPWTANPVHAVVHPFLSISIALLYFDSAKPGTQQRMTLKQVNHHFQADSSNRTRSTQRGI